MKTKQGKAVNDELLDEWANSFESGTWPEGKTVSPGRPPLAADSNTKILSFRISASKAAAFEKKATERGETRSQAFRDFVDMYLEA